LHARATAALQEMRDVVIELSLKAGSRHVGIENGQRRKIDNNKLNTMLRMMQVTMGK
jgi:hypothetical protein